MQEKLTAGMSDVALLAAAPAVMSHTPSPFTSVAYKQYSTLDVVEAMRNNDWVPTHANQTKTTLQFNVDYCKHVVRFTREGLSDQREGRVEVVLINSHDGKSSYRLAAGYYKLVCSNGLVVGRTFEMITFRHVGFMPQQVVDASMAFADKAGDIHNEIDKWRGLRLTDGQRHLYGMQAIKLAMPNIADRFTAADVVEPKRDIDREPTLWNTFNTAQERITQGGIPMQGLGTRTSRGISSVGRNVAVNQALWDMTSDMYKHFSNKLN